MGQQNSIPLSLQLQEQRIITNRIDGFDSYFRDFVIITNQDQNSNKNKKIIIRKLLILQNHLEVEQFYQSFISIDKKPFNLLYPFQIAQWVGNNNNDVFEKINLQKICARSPVVSVYFDGKFMNNTLAEYCLYHHNITISCRQSKNGLNSYHNKSQLKNYTQNSITSRNIHMNNNLFNVEHQGIQQNQIWFIINEITRSLQILTNSKHAHWNICPNTIFYNSNQNWFIHDSYYVIGPNHQNFLTYKMRIKNHNIMSHDIMKAVENGVIVDAILGISQDIYCFGYTVLFMMGLPWFLDKNPLIRHQKVKQLLNKPSIIDKYTTNLLKTVKSMIEPYESQRITIGRLREKLKPIQNNIIDQSIRKNFKSFQSLNIKTTKKNYRKSLQKNQPCQTTHHYDNIRHSISPKLRQTQPIPFYNHYAAISYQHTLPNHQLTHPKLKKTKQTCNLNTSYLMVHKFDSRFFNKSIQKNGQYPQKYLTQRVTQENKRKSYQSFGRFH